MSYITRFSSLVILGNVTRKVDSLTTSQTLDATHDIVEVRGSSLTITLPTITKTGMWYTIKNLNTDQTDTTKIITIARNGGEYIDEANSNWTLIPRDCIQLVSYLRSGPSTYGWMKL